MSDSTRPSVEQIAWVFEKLLEHLEDPGSLRELVFDRMELDADAYQVLLSVGGLDICNALEVAASLSDVSDYYIKPDDESGGYDPGSQLN